MDEGDKECTPRSASFHHVVGLSLTEVSTKFINTIVVLLAVEHQDMTLAQWHVHGLFDLTALIPIAACLFVLAVTLFWFGAWMGQPIWACLLAPLSFLVCCLLLCSSASGSSVSGGTSRRIAALLFGMGHVILVVLTAVIASLIGQTTATAMDGGSMGYADSWLHAFGREVATSSTLLFIGLVVLSMHRVWRYRTGCNEEFLHNDRLSRNDGAMN